MEKPDKVEVMEAIAEERIKELAGEYQQIKEENLNHIDTSRLDNWFEDYMEKHEKRKPPVAEPNKSNITSIKLRHFHLSRVAVFALVLLIAGSGFALSTEAIRLRIFGLFTETNDEYTLLNIGETTELAQYIQENWSGSYYLSMIPEGYSFTEVNESGTTKTMYFLYGNHKLTFHQDKDKSSVALDTEDATTESLLVEGQQAFYKEKGTNFSLVWVNNSGTSFRINSTEFSKDELIQIAENIKIIQ